MGRIIGIDLDNTIVTYDSLLHRLALEKGYIDNSVPVVKEQIRDAMRKSGMEEEWILLQGYLYGPAMTDAESFPGVKDFFRDAQLKGHTIFIISHKTRHPYKGPQYDLHEASLKWLESQGFIGNFPDGLPRTNVFLMENKESKREMIAEKKCGYFIDDLPEFLLDSSFPSNVNRILFSPNRTAAIDTDLYHNVTIATSWIEIGERLI